ncbi:MAG: tRNA (adenosine(37)-N6)-threonylcarbamoyltransferase complex ATPase subunit type 1 TsaE [Mycobacteriales bacterium]|nr:tRNA (adenosine(37)-N6)-threonylcarbamoyltransferase complex ATPase subunit type 1 TsaE [Mycobacteriales bacterium]
MSAASYSLPLPEDTRALGAALAALLRPGDLVVLTGPLGAGKTALTQGIGDGLGITGVTSPTFVIAREHHAGRLPLVHVDAYRLGSALELDDLDLDSALEDCVTVVEWGEGLAERLADSWLEVRLARGGGGDDERVARLDGRGPRWRDVALDVLLESPPARSSGWSPAQP